MENHADILDADVLEENSRSLHQLASGQQRFFNMLIDTAAYYMLIFACSFFVVFLNDPDLVEVLPFFTLLLIFLYYFSLETIFGKTIGKMITRTQVVTLDGMKPSTGQIAGRTLSRFVPFDAFSFFGDPVRGWHDRWSDTYVISDVAERENKLNNLQS